MRGQSHLFDKKQVQKGLIRLLKSKERRNAL